VDLAPGRLEELLARYVADGPRYTSYPSAPVWTERYDAEAFRADLAAREGTEGEALSLYVHVPFCRSLCHFCACNRVVTRRPELPARYLETIAREIELVREALDGAPRTTQLHWGGGTPTHLEPEQIRRLHRALGETFPTEPGAELSIEADPRVTGEAHLEALRECGFRRLSLGVQDFDPRVQRAIHRLQPVQQTASLGERARRLGFESVGFDLIYGLPFQTEASFAATLDTVVALAPDRIALYGYAHVTWVAPQQRGFERHDLPDPPTRLRLFALALERLLRAGYVHVGLDHFARPADALARALRERTLRRNFMGYTTQAGVRLLGVGPSAISELPTAYAQSARDLEAWEAAVRAGRLATFRGHRLGPDDRRRRFAIARLMCHGELAADEYRAEFGSEVARDLASARPALAAQAADGLVRLEEDGSVRVTELGQLFLRNVAMAFDAYLPEQQRSGRRVFSRTV
jgi:oxygen-independent coproporphyrinogen-3 oxidase